MPAFDASPSATARTIPASDTAKPRSGQEQTRYLVLLSLIHI